MGPPGDGKNQEAAIRAAIEWDPGNVDARNDLAVFLAGRGRDAEAAAVWRGAVGVKPGRADLWGNLGILLMKMGEVDGALEAAREAVRIEPGNASAWNTVGAGLAAKLELGGAIEAYRKAIAATPGFAWAHWNLALALLVTGQFAEGWDEYEWRTAIADFPMHRIKFQQPRWNGEALNGRRILLTCEQGFGDAIQMLRYVPMVNARGGRVVMGGPPELRRVFETFEGIEEVVVPGPWPAFDVWYPLLGLPRVFGTRVETIPSSAAYLSADGKIVEAWREKLRGIDGFKKVGLVWRGKAEFGNDRNRSMSLADFGSLAEIDGVALVSIQKGDAARQAASAPAGMRLLDLTQELSDFAETAGLIANLDLVISVDTAVAHLAGAMGKPVWVLLPFAPDWRWGLGRADSGWYGSARLFRQRVAGDWKGVVGEVCEAVRKELGEKG